MKKFFTKEYWKDVWKILQTTFTGFSNDKGLKLSASLAYYTIFSIGPLFIIIISLVSAVYGREAIEGELYPQIKSFVGPGAAAQIQSIIKSQELSGKTSFALVIGIVTLVLGATSVFLEIQDSLNMIWRVKAKPKKGWLQMLKNRFLSFSLIISLGFLLLVSLLINAIILALQNKLTRLFPGMTVIVTDIVNLAITFFVISFLFGIIFKFLPDVKIKWKTVRAGAFFTAILFMLGRYAIGLYIQNTGTASTYGAAGSIIVILLWIYYTSAILYFGAEFTQVYAESTCDSIEPEDYAVHIDQVEREKDVDTLTPKHPDIAKSNDN
ncbi:YihY family inner membrane protein [Pedobacter sp. HMF7647]|uniref:YihY family inner membrane protein n=1 Tax=Hufsiella arboris TaxID=2695275 RepID=A0A7K1Y579_9SPHI|nr:YihY/virulence factor BrkB family protein [Hufsiella arboris]MXV49744.1 YihY family inner membrane protein [Hufsiella arboris]